LPTLSFFAAGCGRWPHGVKGRPHTTHQGVAMPAQKVKMSITQALVELKLLRSRIFAAEEEKFIMLKTKKDKADVEQFSRDARATEQSFRDLLARYASIKSAIVASNATATVNIAGRDYIVAEAVERKRMASWESDFIKTLKEQYKNVMDAHRQHEKLLEERLDKLLMQELGKDNKTSVDVVTSLTSAFQANNKAEVIDPLNLAKYIREHEKELEDFLTNVDWVLSQSNGNVFIEV
jgi:hypothetical protein